MLRYLLPTLALAGLAGAASAADLPSRSVPPAFVAAPVFTWTGFYVGANAGYVFNGETRFDRTVGSLPNNNAALVAGLRPFANSVKDEGFSVGGQIGYNYQIGNVVLGVETDLAYTDLDRVETLSNTTTLGPLVTPGAPPTTRVNQYRGSLDFLGTVRARIGYAFDRFMIYGTGGLAYGQVDNRVTFFIPGGLTPFFDGRQDDVKTGYAFGGGIEYAMPTSSFLNVFSASAVTLKLEYLHYELSSDRFEVPGVNGGPGSYTVRARNDGDLVRVGLNYKF
jgi:outer membrane immunogenic protein